MNTVVSSAFKVSAARMALGANSRAWSRPRFWALLIANVFLLCAFALLIVHIGVMSRQQAYLCAQLGGEYTELSRQKADLSARLESLTSVQQLRQVVASGRLGLVPRSRPAVSLGKEPRVSDMGAHVKSELVAPLQMSVVGSKAKSVIDLTVGAVRELSLLERTGRTD